MKFCFVFICQQGDLEIKSMLLAASLKEHLRCDYELVAAIPHPPSIWGTIGAQTEQLIKDLDIRKVSIENYIDNNYPIGNKLSCLGIQTNADKIVFLDSDILCLKAFNPEQHFISPFNAVAADIPTFKNWKPVYALFNMDLPEERIKSNYSKTEMYPYFNAGMIAIDNINSFSQEWIASCKEIDQCKNIMNKRPWLDQIGLPIVLKKLQWNYTVINKQFNFPAHLIKIPESLPYLCHYHFPDVLIKDKRLLNFIDYLSEKHPLLKEIAKDRLQWKFLSHGSLVRFQHKMRRNIIQLGKHLYFTNLKIVKKHILALYPNKNANRNIVITGIPRSGTSYLCKLLYTIENSVVINEPNDIFDLFTDTSSLNNLNDYYKILRLKISKGKRIRNKIYEGEIIEDTSKNIETRLIRHTITDKSFLLSVKNTFAFLSVLPFYKRDMPEAIIMVCIRNPIDTIASWKKSFPHLSDVIFSTFPDVFFNNTFREVWQQEAVQKIRITKDFEIKRALLWNYLAEIIIRNKESILLIKYENLIQNPNKEFQELWNKFPNVSYDLPKSKLRSSKSSMSKSEIEKIKTICGKTALKLGYQLIYEK